MRYLPVVVAAILLVARPALADDPVSLKNFTPPKDNSKDEPLAGKFSLEKAANFMDSAALHWTKSQGCFSCHSNLTYLYARPLLFCPAPAQSEVRQALEAGRRRGRAGIPRWSWPPRRSPTTIRRRPASCIR
jgi:squalene-hopene/tetraprenyl-beta-curcumene cyclase